MGAEQTQLQLVDGFWRFWSGNLVDKLADEDFLATARETEALIGKDWDFVPDEGVQALGITTGHRGLEGFIAIWSRWLEAFESWEGILVGAPVLLERERVLARLDVRARSNAGVDLRFFAGILYYFDGFELRRIVGYRTWDKALAGAGIDEAQVDALQRESARVLEEG